MNQNQRISKILEEYPELEGKFDVPQKLQANKLTSALIDASETDKARRREVELIPMDNLLDATNKKLLLVLSYLDSYNLSTASTSQL